jgi:hypothetical protein
MTDDWHGARTTDAREWEKVVWRGERMNESSANPFPIQFPAFVVCMWASFSYLDLDDWTAKMTKLVIITARQPPLSPSYPVMAKMQESMEDPSIRPMFQFRRKNFDHENFSAVCVSERLAVEQDGVFMFFSR